MNIKKFVNCDSFYRDLTTGKKLNDEEFHRRVIEKLGGLEAIIPYIPFTYDEIYHASLIDKYLNNLSMSKWDMASGFISRGSDVQPIFSGLPTLYSHYKINDYSLSDGVSILKNAALMWIKQMASINQASLKRYAKLRIAEANRKLSDSEEAEVKNFEHLLHKDKNIYAKLNSYELTEEEMNVYYL